jgi:hypothetical protein
MEECGLCDNFELHAIAIAFASQNLMAGGPRKHAQPKIFFPRASPEKTF